MKRSAPILFPLLYWLVGLILGKNLPDVSIILMAASALCLVTAIFIPRLRMFLLLLVCLLAGMLRISQKPPQQRILTATLHQRERITQQAEFTIGKRLADSVYEMQLSKLAGADFKLRLLLYHPDSLSVGSRYQALVEVSALQPDPVLDIYPSVYFARAKILHQLTKLDQKSWHSYVPDARKWLEQRLDRHAAEDAPIAKALLLSDLGAKRLYREILVRGGMIHLIVVSGLHVWFIYGMLLVLLKGLMPRRAVEGLILLAITAFAALNYWAAPITRALLMIAVGIFSRWMGRRVSGLQTLALSLFCITLVFPAQFFDLGLQLSFISVGIIMLALPHVNLWSERHRPLTFWQLQSAKFINYILLSLMVSVAILPLTLYKLGSGSLNGVVGNLVGVPLTGLLLPLSVLVLIFDPAKIPGAAFVSSYRFALWVFEHWMNLAADLPFAIQDYWIGMIPALGLTALLIPIFIWMRRMRRPSWSLVLGMWLAGLLMILIPPLIKARQGGIWFFNCGTADCALIQLPDGGTILVDSGPGKNVWASEADSVLALDANSWAGKKLLPWLKRNGIRQIDQLILTHTHADHTGGVPALISAIPIKKLIVTDETQGSRLWQIWRRQGWFENTPIITVNDTFSLHLGKSRIKFLHPDKSWITDNENERSIVFRLDHKGKKYLFTGDIESSAEAWLLSRYPDEIDVDYIKIPHHGSRTSSSSAFLRQLSPQEAWISASRRNRFGFPHPQTLQRLQSQGVQIKYTHQGTIYLKL